MDDRARYLAKLKERLQATAETGGTSPVLDPAALAEASGLRARLVQGSTDLEASWVLGDFYWQRSQALGIGGAADRSAAVHFLTPCFIANEGAIPEELLAELADAALPEAVRRYQVASESMDVDVISAAIDVWGRIAFATQEEHDDYAARMNDLSVLLSRRYRRSGSMPDLDMAIMIDTLLVKRESENPRYLVNLCIDLCDRYEKSANPQDIDVALAAADGALSMTPSNHPQRQSRLHNRERLVPSARGRRSIAIAFLSAGASCRRLTREALGTSVSLKR